MRVLLNTVGTSLLTHWKTDPEDLSEARCRQMIASIARLPKNDRRCGAELGSIFSLADQREISPGDLLCFLVSDTAQGLFAGRVLNGVAAEWGYRTGQIDVIKKLQSSDPAAFEQGLRNLVRTIAQIYRTHGKSGEHVLLNATGGYKAQISFAGIIGQVFGLPVFYQFEDFPRAIKLPPLPVSFDMNDWLSYRHVFDALEGESGGDLLRASDSRLRELPQRLRVLIEQNEGFVTLNALGELYHLGFKERFAAAKALLLPCDSGIPAANKKIQHEDQNKGKHPGLQRHLERIAEKAYVTGIKTIRYVPEKPAQARFRADPAASDRIKGTYWDGAVAVEFLVYLSENDAKRAQGAAADLAETFA